MTAVIFLIQLSCPGVKGGRGGGGFTHPWPTLSFPGILFLVLHGNRFPELLTLGVNLRPNMSICSIKDAWHESASVIGIHTYTMR